MKKSNITVHPSATLAAGVMILAAAQVVDTTRVKPRLRTFAKGNRDYGAAQHDVVTAEGKLAVAQKAVGDQDHRLDEHIEELARALVSDGAGRHNPFTVLGSLSPSDIKALPAAEKTRALHTLVAAVQHDSAASQATRRAARAAEETAQALAAALQPLDKLEAALRTARETREHLGRIWKRNLSALKRSARAADDDGGPALSQALFGGLQRGRPKKPKPEPAAATPAADPAAPQPPAA